MSAEVFILNDLSDDKYIVIELIPSTDFVSAVIDRVYILTAEELKEKLLTVQESIDEIAKSPIAEVMILKINEAIKLKNLLQEIIENE